MFRIFEAVQGPGDCLMGLQIMGLTQS